MAVTQDNMPQQPPEAAQPGQAPSSAPDTQVTATGQMPPASTTQLPGGNADQGQPPALEPNFSEVLQQQIAQAIQPVLNEFRQNMAQTIEQERATLTPSSTPGNEAAGPLQQPAQQQPVQQQVTGPVGQQPLDQATQQMQTQQAPPQPAQPAQPAQQPTQPTVMESAGQAAGQLASQGQQSLQAPSTGVLQPALQAVERQGENLLQSLLVAGLTALLTEATHAAIQQRAEQGLHVLVAKSFDAMPDGTGTQEMQNKTERTLQLILRESLDAIFTQGMRTTVQQGGQQAIQESFRGDFGGALGKLQDTLKAMVEALLTVLRREWQTVIRLILALALLALESSLAQPKPEKQTQAAG